MILDPRTVLSPTDVGIVYVADGLPAVEQVRQSVAALRKLTSPPLHVTLFTNDAANIWTAETRPTVVDAGWGGRGVKVNLNRLTPYKQTLYLDADTRPRADLAPLLTPLSAGYDMVIAPSANQGVSAFRHVDAAERVETLDALGYTPLQFQAGVFAFVQNERTEAFFEAWRSEWAAFAGTEDQAAFARALHRAPIRLWVLSTGLVDVLILHLFGTLRRKGST